jgi:hypothetical protein
VIITYTIDLNNAHFMTIYPEEESGERRSVHDSEAVRLPRNEWQCGILVEPDC